MDCDTKEISVPLYRNFGTFEGEYHIHQDRKSDISSSTQGPMVYPKMKKKIWSASSHGKNLSLPSVRKVEKKKISNT